MAKYIIDISDSEETMWEGFNGDLFITITMNKGTKTCVNTDLKMIPYTEPDEDKIRQMAHEEAWEFAKTVSIMIPEDKRECWGTEKYNSINLGYSYQEAKARYEEWKADKDKICVGDEVEYPPNKAKGIVIKCHVPDVYAEVDKYAVFIGTSVEYLPREWLTKTGRVFPEVAELLKKMKGE